MTRSSCPLRSVARISTCRVRHPAIRPIASYGTIEFVIYYNPITVGALVMHCHVLQHEDIGMMQRVDILPAP